MRLSNRLAKQILHRALMASKAILEPLPNPERITIELLSMQQRGVGLVVMRRRPLAAVNAWLLSPPSSATACSMQRSSGP